MTPPPTPRRGSITFHPLMPGQAPPVSVRPDEALIALLQAGYAMMAPHADAVAVRFYDSLFKRHPNLRSMFPPDMTAQRTKLMNSLAMVIEGLRAPDEMKRRLQALGAKHRDHFGALPSHYPIVCDLLAAAMRDVVPGWSDLLNSEWRRALELVSTIMQSSPPGASATPSA